MKYEKIKYPDGQISVKLADWEDTYITRERINSYEDLFKLKSIVEAYKTTGDSRKLNLFIPSLFGQRSDRRFSTYQSFDLKIICDFINSMNFARVDIFDPHSDVSLALIDNSVKVSSFGYVEKSIHDLYFKGSRMASTVLVSPDAGAYKKVFEYGEKLKLPIVAANKHRDLDGAIQLKFVGDVKNKECLIVDDICDGGYTFYLLAKALREQGASKVYLYVSHGYFSKGLITKLEKTDENSSLSKFLDGIYCTNSVKDVYNNEFDGYRTHDLGNLITQYKII